MSIIEKLTNLDRRIVFLLVGLGVIIPIVFRVSLPIQAVSPPVQALYQMIEEKIRPGEAIILSFDYGPSSEPELSPMAQAILRHCFRKGIRVVALAIFPLGGDSMEIKEVSNIAREFDVVDGVHYVNLGYTAGSVASMRRMNTDIHEVFPTDINGRPVGEIPLMKQVKNYSNISLIVSLATGVIGEWYANLVNAQFGVPVAVGTTAVGAPKYYAYLDTGQLVGLLGGLKGAAEYEKLIDKFGTGKQGMAIQNFVHLIIIFFIVLGNVIYFVTIWRQKTASRKVV